VQSHEDAGALRVGLHRIGGFGPGERARLDAFGEHLELDVEMLRLEEEAWDGSDPRILDVSQEGVGDVGDHREGAVILGDELDLGVSLLDVAVERAEAGVGLRDLTEQALLRMKGVELVEALSAESAGFDVVARVLEVLKDGLGNRASGLVGDDVAKFDVQRTIGAQTFEEELRIIQLVEADASFR
jgi:hypothetical protein